MDAVRSDLEAHLVHEATRVARAKKANRDALVRKVAEVLKVHKVTKEARDARVTWVNKV